MIVGIISGYFLVLGPHHIDLFKDAKSKSDYLICIINNDKQVKLKNSVPILNENERFEVVSSIKYVDEATISVSKDRSVNIDLVAIALRFQNDRKIFFNGGDVNNADITRETETCKNHNIEMMFGVGGFEKKNSSSWMVQRVIDHIKTDPCKYGFSGLLKLN